MEYFSCQAKEAVETVFFAGSPALFSSKGTSWTDCHLVALFVFIALGYIFNLSLDSLLSLKISSKRLHSEVTQNH